ncbi:MAG: glycosyltransferase family 39 protein [Bacteriovoracaceae bacterium]|nr:glycosyltransferase family 39 protein [Bacteroidota bacterium]
MAKQHPTRSKTEKQPLTDISVFPFFTKYLGHHLAGAAIGLVYFIVILSIGLKYHVVGDYHVETDFFQAYVPSAKDILNGIWTIEDFRGPAYPAVLAVFGFFIKDFFAAGIVVSALTAALTLFFTYELIRKLFRTDIAFIVVLLMAVNKTFVQYAYTAGTDMTFNCFAAATAYFLLKDEQRSWIGIALTAFSAALAYLTRFNGLFVIAAIPLIITLLNIYKIEMKQRLIVSVAFVLLFFAFIAPWGIHSLNEKGSFFFNRNYLNIAYEMFAKGKVGWDQYWNVESVKYSSLGQVILADPGLFVSTVFRNLVEHFISDMELLIGWGLGICSIAGVLGFVQNRPNARQAGYYIFGLMMFLVLLLVFYGERFSMYLIPLYATLAIGSLTWERWREIPIYNGTVIALALVVWSFVTSYNYNKENIDSGPQEIKVIADWFNANIKDSDASKIIVCRKPHIAFYMDKTMKYFPYVTGFDALEQETKKLNASYFFYGIYEANMRPEFQSLLDPNQAPAWLEPITYTVNPPSVLYRVKY